MASSSSLVYWSKFHVNIITCSGVMLTFKDWPETQKSEISTSEFCPISGDWSELGIPNSARMSLMKCYWMLQMQDYSVYRFWVIKGKLLRVKISKKGALLRVRNFLAPEQAKVLQMHIYYQTLVFPNNLNILW